MQNALRKQNRLLVIYHHEIRQGRVRWLDGSGWHGLAGHLPHLCEATLYHWRISRRIRLSTYSMSELQSSFSRTIFSDKIGYCSRRQVKQIGSDLFTFKKCNLLQEKRIFFCNSSRKQTQFNIHRRTLLNLSFLEYA